MNKIDYLFTRDIKPIREKAVTCYQTGLHHTAARREGGNTPPLPGVTSQNEKGEPEMIKVEAVLEIMNQIERIRQENFPNVEAGISIADAYKLAELQEISIELARIRSAVSRLSFDD